jgi:hypothetical protein
MVAKVTKQRAMGFTAGPFEQGTVTPGMLTRQQIYNYPGVWPATLMPLKEAPNYTTMTETWDSMDTPAAVTQYMVQQLVMPCTATLLFSCQRVEVVQPDGTHHIQLAYVQSSFATKWQNGLVFHDELQDAAQTPLQQTNVTWEVGSGYGPYRHRVEVTDERQQLTASEFDYDANDQVTEVRDYDYGGTQVLRAVHTDYGTTPSDYASRHIFNLPTTVSVYRGAVASGACEARTGYMYDGQPLANTPEIVNHDDASNPFAPRVWVPNCSQVCDPTAKPPCQTVCDVGQWQTPYQSATDLRGNVTQITRYTDPVGISGAITETRRYDIAGNLLTGSSTPNVEVRFDYTVANEYAYPTAHVRGALQLAKIHTASDECSGIQGYQQWSYLDSNNAQLTYDETTGVWRGIGNVSLIPRGGIPGAVRRWTAPAGGRVHITGNAQSLDSTGTISPLSRVVVSIRQGVQVLWQAIVPISPLTSAVPFDIATVVALGDTIDFVISKAGAQDLINGGTPISFDPTLEITPWAAALSASPSQPAVGWAWGMSGSSGDGSTSNRSTPGEVSALTQLVAVAVAAGGHSLALASDGSVWAWGNNGNGQLGDGTTTTRFAPTQVVGLGGVAAISAGWAHSLALAKDGTVWAWGWNTSGQLGTGTTQDSHTQVQISGLTGVVAVAAGKEQSFALKADGTVLAWGYNAYGNLGDGTQTMRPMPVPVSGLSGLSGVVAIAAGHNHTLALTGDGSVWAWGQGSLGALGNGATPTVQSTPVRLTGLRA